MKLIRLCLIALLLQPCPVCWEHGFTSVEQCENGESVKHISTPACCSKCLQVPHAQEQNQTQQHDGPCLCHVTDVIYAQTTSSNHLRGVTTPLSTNVDAYCQSAQITVAKNSDFSSFNVPLTVPLRI